MLESIRPLKVFLCHSSGDKPIVRGLYQKLAAEDWIDPWLDEEKLYPGQDWNLEIEKAVEAADAIIVCLSNSSITKEGYVQRELRIVLDYADYKPEGTLYIIPVRLEACEPPRRLRPWQYADYFPKDQRERAYQRLLTSLQMRASALGIQQEKLIVAVPEPANAQSAKVENLGAIKILNIPCAICHSMIESGQSFGICNACKTPYHKECWDYNSGCAVLGCVGSRDPHAFQAVKVF